MLNKMIFFFLEQNHASEREEIMKGKHFLCVYVMQRDDSVLSC